MGSIDTRAGASALSHYKHGLRTWRRWAAAPLVVSLLVSAGVAYLFWRYFPHGSFFAGMLFGGNCALAQWVWDDPPERVARWKRGAEGERKTGRQLRALPADRWWFYHDRADRFGNIDHIVVGRGGIFVLDSKNLAGNLTIGEHGLTATFSDAPWGGYTLTGLSRSMNARAAYLKDRVRSATGLTYYVQAVVVVWGHLAQGSGVHNNVTYIDGARLAEWLDTQRVRLSNRDANFIRLAIEADEVVGEAEELED